MSTTPIRCPKCGVLVRVAVQASRIELRSNAIFVMFQEQNAAHVCKEEPSTAN